MEHDPNRLWVYLPKKVCKNGHDLTLPNVFMDRKKIHDRCRLCKLDRQHRWRKSPAVKYRRVKYELKRNIKSKKSKILELERILLDVKKDSN